MSNFRRRLIQCLKKEDKYTKLEYLESTGIQYIDTEVKTKQSLKIECTFSGTEKGTLLFGSRKTGQLDGLTWGVNYIAYVYCGFGGSTQANKLTVNTVDGNKHTIVLSNDVYTIDDISQDLPNRGTFSDFYNIYLFTWNNSNVADSRCFKGKIYDFKIYDEDILIQHLIPVLDVDGVPCMYDKVNDKFYYNHATGKFLY